MKKNIYKTLFILLLMFSYSCEEYLDKAPETTLGKEDVFKDFDHAQGFVEEMYSMVVDHQLGAHGTPDYLLGDDGYLNGGGFIQSHNIDKGKLNWWYSNQFNIFNSKPDAGTGQNNAFKRYGVWKGSLIGIRKANIAIESIDLMVNASQEEKNVILGQAYFFRAFFHFEILKYWGRFPYIDVVLADEYQLPRPATYKESALKANEDFKRAAELLPNNWDNHAFGDKTFENNRGRLTKGAAYAFQGKNLLIAASPLMKGSMNTYDYDTELAAMAVDAFAEVLKLADQGRYALSSFANYEEVFWDVPAKIWPGGTEFIFNGTSFNYNHIKNNLVRSQMDGRVSGGGGTRTLTPTHNFIHNNFGMANGLSIEDDLSGAYGTPTYDATKPFENRDPRFYKWITVDGDVLATKGASAHRIAKLYIGGTHKGLDEKHKGSRTGYFLKKFYPTLHSRANNISKKYTPWRLRMRLTDVYLMYAEALHASKNSATSAPGSYNLTAEQTINLFRVRAGIPNVNSTIVGNANKFMDELRRERSVELSFESHRWVDIRRWVVAHLPKYKDKTRLDFPKDHSYFEEVSLVTRICDYPKHYWLPFKTNQTQFYEGFEQNPGW